MLRHINVQAKFVLKQTKSSVVPNLTKVWPDSGSKQVKIALEDVTCIPQFVRLSA